MICTGEPLFVFVQLVGKVLVSRLYLSPPYSSTILLEKNKICSWYVRGTFSSAPRFIRYLFSNKIIGNLSLTKSFFFNLLCFCISVWCCLVLKNRAKWMKEYIYIYILGLQPRDKAATLGVKTKEYFLKKFTWK